MSETIALIPPSDAAAMLGISTKTLREHVRSGEIAAVKIGCGSLKPRLAFHQSDIQDFINRRRIRLCQSTSTKTARITNTISKSGVIGFTARLEKLASEKRNK